MIGVPGVVALDQGAQVCLVIVHAFGSGQRAAAPDRPDRMTGSPAVHGLDVDVKMSEAGPLVFQDEPIGRLPPIRVAAVHGRLGLDVAPGKPHPHRLGPTHSRPRVDLRESGHHVFDTQREQAILGADRRRRRQADRQLPPTDACLHRDGGPAQRHSQLHAPPFVVGVNCSRARSRRPRT